MKKVIDISSYQAPGSINYDLLSKNIDGVILRAGFTGYGSGESLNKDDSFETHYKELRKRNVNIGVYWYSCANEPGEGKAEAEFLYNIIKDKTLELPVYWDTEDQHHQAKVSKTQLSKVGMEFLDYLEDKGYYVGIYASTSWLNDRLDMSMLKDYDVWVAHYGVDKPSYKGQYGMWQYTDSGRLPGFDGNLDMNHMYEDYPTIIRSAGLNGLGKSNVKVSTAKPTKLKDLNVIVNEVLSGKWGNGEDRKIRLNNAGYDYNAVQKLVNEKLNKKSNREIAYEVISGKWGNGDARKTKLTQAGYDYSKVQSEVNKLI